MTESRAWNFSWGIATLLLAAWGLLPGCGDNLPAIGDVDPCPVEPMTVSRCADSGYMATCEAHDGPRAFCTVQGVSVVSLCVMECP